MRAAKKENVEALLQAGAKPDVAGKRGTAVDVAEDKTLVSIVKDFNSKVSKVLMIDVVLETNQNKTNSSIPTKTKDPNDKKEKAEKDDDDGFGIVLATNAEVCCVSRRSLVIRVRGSNVTLFHRIFQRKLRSRSQQALSRMKRSTQTSKRCFTSCSSSRERDT